MTTRPDINDIVAALDQNDCGLVISCETPTHAATVTRRLYEDTDATYHIEHYPVINDDTDEIDYYAVLIRRLTYDRDVGWMSADIPDEPDIELTGALQEDSHVRRFAVAAETVNDPYHNWTIVGHLSELDLSEYDSVEDAARDAAQHAFETMPEHPNELVDVEFKVFVIEDDVYVPLDEIRDTQ